MDSTPSPISPRTPNEIICDVLYCLEREDTAQCQMVCQEWNNLIVSLKNLLPTRYFNVLWFLKEEIRLYRASFGDLPEFRLYVNGTNVDNWTNNRVNVNQKYQNRSAQEVIQYLKDAEYGNIDINYMDTKGLLKILKDVSTITEGPIKAKRSNCQAQRLDDFL
uniref:F-box domain-containing protein n=1 Tax=Acrobeloides nanus TaxID=290746 RepID=A0A914CB44_9BILA